ncbi:hypothetical protein [Planctomicrobium sp. SH527]|uniref:hypothetical protein n=1 Tax=Planctomicrobium sp. SH527 TaxID=3448123 RepID=UPI003F5C6A48
MTAGSLIRQNATPTLGNERVFVCIVAGNTNPTTEPTWDITKGAKTNDISVTWQECTGQPSVNGDVENTQDWDEASGKVVSLGQIIKSVAETHYFICSNPGTAGGSEPSWNTTAGQTTSDGSVTWTCIGAVGNFGAWAAPHSRLPNALNTNWGTNGATFFISDNHAESQATAWTTTMLGLGSNPSYYLCVDDSVAPPTDLSTTATISSDSSVSIGGGSGVRAFYMYGVTFNCGTGSANVSLALQGPSQVYEACGFNLVTSGSNPRILLSQTSSTSRLSVFRNCTFSFGASSQSIALESGRIEIIGGSVAATGSAPTTAFGFGATGTLLVRDCDLSGIVANLINMNVGGTYDCIFANCRLGSGVALAAGVTGWPGGNTLRVHNCDSEATNYRMYTAYYWGTSQQDTGTYNDEGATDGTTPISWQIVTNDLPYFAQPFVSEQIFRWVDTIGSELTATVEIAGSTTLYDDEVWMEIEYLGNASYPLGSFANCRNADVLAARAALPSSSATWTGSPAVTQKLVVAFTPQMKGPIKARIFVAKKNATVYVDPLITIT